MFKNKNIRFLLFITSLFFLTNLAACTTKKPIVSPLPVPLPTEYEIKGIADRQLNLDAGGRPLSLVVRTYQLKEKQEFSKLTYELISSGRQESELLGAELNAPIGEYVLVPEAQISSKEEWKQGTRYIGVVGFFRTPDEQAWRFLLNADDVRRNGLSFTASNCFLNISKPVPAAIPGQILDRPPTCPSRPVTILKPVAPRR